MLSGRRSKADHNVLKVRYYGVEDNRAANTSSLMPDGGWKNEASKIHVTSCKLML